MIGESLMTKKIDSDYFIDEDDFVDDIIKEESIVDDIIDSPQLGEEHRKNKHQHIQQKIASILIGSYIFLEMSILFGGIKGLETSFFDGHMDSFRVLVSVVVGYYFGKNYNDK